MKIKLILGILFILVLIISCSKTPTGKVTQPICNKPYILVGTDCCLDKDDNAICDKDETVKEITVKCGDGKCDEGEGCNSCEKDCGKCYTISDLQAEIGNVLFPKQTEFAVLKKDKKIDDIQFYTFTLPKAVKLGQVGQILISKVLDKEFIVVSIIEDEKDYLKEGDSFFNFIKKHDEYLSSQLKRNKDELIKMFKEGEIWENERIKTFYSLKNYEDSNIRFTYENSTSKEDIVFDNLTLLDTVSNRIIEKNYISLEDYEIIYDSEWNQKLNVNIKGINYLQGMSMLCTPSITITIYHENIPPQTELNKMSLINFVNNEREGMISDAQSLINMCEKRYDFSYWRAR